MSHRAVRLLIRDAVKSVRDEVQFIYGRKSDANAVKNKRLPFVTLSPLTSTANLTDDSFNLTTTYSIGLVFYRMDDLQGNEEGTAKVLDEMADFADKAIQYLNRSGEDYGESIQDGLTTDMVKLSNIRKEAVIKVMSDMLTGWIVEFDLIVPDNFDYCSIYDE